MDIPLRQHLWNLNRTRKKTYISRINKKQHTMIWSFLSYKSVTYVSTSSMSFFSKQRLPASICSSHYQLPHVLFSAQNSISSSFYSFFLLSRMLNTTLWFLETLYRKKVFISKTSLITSVDQFTCNFLNNVLRFILRYMFWKCRSLESWVAGSIPVWGSEIVSLKIKLDERSTIYTVIISDYSCSRNGC